MSLAANLKLLAVLALIGLAVWLIAVPRPRLLADGNSGNFSLLQAYRMQWADGRIESLYQSEKAALDTPLQADKNGCRSTTRMKAVGAALSADARQIATLTPMAYPHKRTRYRAQSDRLAAKARAFQAMSEDCE